MGLNKVVLGLVSNDSVEVGQSNVKGSSFTDKVNLGESDNKGKVVLVNNESYLYYPIDINNFIYFETMYSPRDFNSLENMYISTKLTN